ncbi:MAG: MG2 domain-containing protein, partial [Bryobacteraceae bacterium]
DGAASLAITEPKPEQVVVLARKGEDFAAVTMYGYSLRSNEDSYWTGYIHTDRPVYRPGHKVHFRGILRIPSASGYVVPAGREVAIEVQDSDARSLLQRKLTVSPMGTIRGDFEIPATAALGYYDIQVRAGDSYMTGGFHVEEYRKPEYEVRVTPSKRRVLQGEAVEALIEARYYYGEPVTGAKAAWVVHRTRYWIPGYADDEMLEEGDGEHYAGEQVVEASGALNADGKLTIRVPTTAGPHDYRYRIEARVTDASNREIAGAGTVVATQGAYHVHIRPSHYVFAPNSRAKFEIEARDYDSNPVPGAVVRVSLAEARWREKERPLPGETEGRTDAQGKAVVEVALAGAGSYVAYVRSRTPEGRDASGSTWIWITGEYSFGRGAERVTIVPDKKSYKPGDVAKVLVLTGVPDAHVWIGTEANTLHTTRAVAARGGSVAIDVPILPEYAPNFFVVASFLKNGQLHHGVKSLKVPPVDKQLQVTVESSKAEYKPGEEGLFTVGARDHLGK